MEEGWGRKIANGYENERGERTSIAIVSSTFARSPTRVVVNKRGDEGALYKEKDSFLFDLSLSFPPPSSCFSFPLCSFRGLLSRFDSLELLSLFNMGVHLFFFFRGVGKKAIAAGENCGRGWGMVYGLTGRFVSLRSVLFGEGSVFFSLFLSLSLLVSTLLLFYATKEVVLFLTINLKSFISLDF